MSTGLSHFRRRLPYTPSPQSSYALLFLIDQSRLINSTPKASIDASNSSRFFAFQLVDFPSTASSPVKAIYSTSVSSRPLFPFTLFPKHAVASERLASPTSGGPSSPLVSPHTPYIRASNQPSIAKPPRTTTIDTREESSYSFSPHTTAITLISPTNTLASLCCECYSIS